MRLASAYTPQVQRCTPQVQNQQDTSAAMLTMLAELSSATGADNVDRATHVDNCVCVCVCVLLLMQT